MILDWLKSRISDVQTIRVQYWHVSRVISERNFRNSNDYLVDSHLGRRNNFMPATRTKAWPVINSSIGFVLFGYTKRSEFVSICYRHSFKIIVEGNGQMEYKITYSSFVRSVGISYGRCNLSYRRDSMDYFIFRDKS